MKNLSPIPQPKPQPVLKNISELDIETPLQSLMRLAKLYNGIYKLDLPNSSVIVVNDAELVNELCDESRFDKKVHAPLEKIRDFGGDGLFTAYTHEPNWEKAHRILVPAFGPAAIKNMFGEMHDIAEQMMLKWERLGEDAVLDVADNFTRLTLDTIALCAFDYRFNSFYQNEMHPFVGAMVNALHEAGVYGRRLPIQNKLMFIAKRNYEREIKYMQQVSGEIIANRRKLPQDQWPKDLLSIMLAGKDPVTGEGLSDENIIYQMVTFLIAGHETTSGLLSFTTYFLLKNPAVLLKAQALVDEVIGNETPTFEHLSKLGYLDQILKETLRIWPTAPVIGLTPYQDTIIGGKYEIKKDDTVLVLIPSLHRDTKAWGNDVEKFDPERFSPERVATIPPNAFKPFGNGQRACIGRPFALQEAVLVLAMILQRFDLIENNPSYQLKIKETLTLKPDGLFVRVKRRNQQNFTTPNSTAPKTKPLSSQPIVAHDSHTSGTPLLVLYGSNSGSSQDFAQRISNDAQAQGYTPTLAPLDNYAGSLPTKGAVIIITASYEGQPTDNARKFVAWLDILQKNALQGVQFAVFGCGNSDWVRTYQAIPKKIEQKLIENGATPILPRGEADAKNDFFGDFDRWYSSFWQELGKKFGQEAIATTQAKYEIELVKNVRANILRETSLDLGTIIENRELVDMNAPNARSKRHIEIQLPEGMTYRAGDYLAVLPTNAPEKVRRVLKRFYFDESAQIVIRAKNTNDLTTLPTEFPVSVSEVLTNYVELNQVVTQNQIKTLVELTKCPPEKKRLEEFVNDEKYKQEILAKRVSLIDILELNPACEISFAAFLEMLPQIKPRQYSISSSPLWNGKHCTLTVAVVDAPAFSGIGRYTGTASHYLANAEVGAKLSVVVKSSNTAFHLPQNPSTPIIMIGAGTGLAPFRGFLQERALQIASGQELGEALLFFGCDARDVDFLYNEELSEWEKMGVVQVRPAFSATQEEGIEFVQDRIWNDRADVKKLLNEGAIIYVCGDGRYMAPAVRATLIKIYQEETNADQTAAENWANDLEKNKHRYVTDIFG